MYNRYVALGDSSTEGLIDPDQAGGFRGWSRRLAARIAAQQGELQYANLGVRGLTTREVRETQLERALALRPDLATLFTGTNDVIAARFDAEAFGRDSEAMQQALVAAGATVLTFTLPDLAPLMPVARRFSPRIAAMNSRLRDVSARTGAKLVDFAAYPVATDRRLWHGDRIHANADGHARIAEALAEALGLEGARPGWRDPLTPPLSEGTVARLGRELWWRTRYLMPWMLAGAVAGAIRRTPPVRPAVLVTVSAERSAGKPWATRTTPRPQHPARSRVE